MKMEINKTMFLVEPEMLQRMATLLQGLRHSDVYVIMNELVALKALPIKSIVLQEVEVEEKSEEAV